MDDGVALEGLAVPGAEAPAVVDTSSSPQVGTGSTDDCKMVQEPEVVVVPSVLE